MFRSEDNGTVQAMAGAGLGTALMPLLAVATRRTRPSRSSRRTCRRAAIALIWHRDRYRTPAARAFVDIALEVCADARGGAPGSLPGRPGGPLVYSRRARQPVASRSDRA